MESYVEVSFLYNCLSIFVSVLLASYSCVQPMKERIAGRYAVSVSLFGVFCFFKGSFILLCCLEVLFFITVFRHKKKLFLYAMALRWFFSFSCFAMLGGSFHNGLYFISIDVNPFPIYLIYGGFLFALKQKWKDLLAKTNYVYDTTLFFEESHLKVKAYLDSGNLLCHHTRPVIFLDEKYQTYFQESSIELVVMNTINTSGVLHCYPCKIQVDGCKAHRAYVSCEKMLSLPFDCDALLNMKLMTLG